MDGLLRPGDVLATTDGLVAYSGIRVGNDQAPDFTAVASFPGLTLRSFQDLTGKDLKEELCIVQ
jgi:hypothetical protein